MANGATPEPELAKLSLEDTNGASKSPNGSGSESGGSNDLKEAFKAFSKFGDTKSDGKHITLSQSDKWMKQAKVIDKKITTTDTGIHFKKLKSLKVSYGDYNKFLEDLATTKKVDLAEIKSKLATCGAPGVLNNSAGKVSVVDRLTDPTKYTGSHKERFDETGKGKGIAGRRNVVENSGYVTGYQHKNTYDKTH